MKFKIVDRTEKEEIKAHIELSEDKQALRLFLNGEHVLSIDHKGELQRFRFTRITGIKQNTLGQIWEGS